MNKILQGLKIDETYTKPVKRPKHFTKVKHNIPLIANYNFMSDIIFLPTSKGYKYLLVMVDLATDAFDIEPLKTKTAHETLLGMKKMFTRNHIKKPYASIRTDDGKEFKGEFEKYLYDNSILHKIALPFRHSQLSNVDSLCNQIDRILVGYMNKIEKETGKSYHNWTDIVDIVRKDLNEMRLRSVPKDIYNYKYPIFNTKHSNKYNVGDIVYRRLDVPQNALGIQENTTRFRTGDMRWDMIPHRAIKVLYYSGKVPYRYMLDKFPNVSFTEKQLLLVKEKESKFIVEKILDKKIIKKQIYYLIKWKGFLKKDSTWESKKNLIEDGLGQMIDDFEYKLLELELEFEQNL